MAGKFTIFHGIGRDVPRIPTWAPYGKSLYKPYIVGIYIFQDAFLILKTGGFSRLSCWCSGMYICRMVVIVGKSAKQKCPVN